MELLFDQGWQNYQYQSFVSHVQQVGSFHFSLLNASLTLHIPCIQQTTLIYINKCKINYKLKDIKLFGYVYSSFYIMNFPPFYNIQMMRDLDFSLNFNFSRQNSNGWQNFSFDDNSQDISLPKNHSVNNQSLLQFQNLLNQPPRPPTSIYNCIESDQEEQGDIREVQYVQNEVEAKHVNSKQYFRMMKRRIKKVMNEYHLKDQLKNQGSKSQQPQTRPKYLYQSRHQHAVRRVRGKDGKFLATRPETQRFRQKKKRGRKPKIATPLTTAPLNNQP